MTHGLRNKIWGFSSMLPGQELAAGHVLPRWSFPLQPGARGGGAVLPLSTAPSCSPGSPFRSAVCAPFSLFQPLAQGQAQAQGCLTQRCLRRLSESTWGETGRYEVQLLRPQEPHPPQPSSLPPTSSWARLHLLLPFRPSARVPAPGSLLGRGSHRVSAGGASWGVLWPLQRGHSQVAGCRPRAPPTQRLAG